MGSETDDEMREAMRLYRESEAKYLAVLEEVCKDHAKNCRCDNCQELREERLTNGSVAKVRQIMRLGEE